MAHKEDEKFQDTAIWCCDEQLQARKMTENDTDTVGTTFQISFSRFFVRRGSIMILDG